MESARRKLSLLILLMVWALPLRVTAQPPEATSIGDDAGSAKLASHAPSKAAVRRQIARLNKLRTAVNKELGLSSSQRSAIDRLFRDYIDTLGGSRGRLHPFGTGASDRDEMASLRTRMRAARKAKDERAARRLREEFRAKMNMRKTAVALSLDDFLRKVDALLRARQRTAFQKLVRNAQVRQGRQRSQNGDLRKLWRAVSRPAVGLSDQQRRAITLIIRDSADAMAQSRREGGDIAEITAQVRLEVLGELTNSQRIKMEVALGLRAKRSAVLVGDPVGEDSDAGEESDKKKAPDEDDDG